ncbi:MAG: SGNH/GDSL hydrolase family protein [Gammaproteobacteria bacterium]|nr:SGNH/GDSL hydrolase family protein [Gammaproteobacteria bacterium]
MELSTVNFNLSARIASLLTLLLGLSACQTLQPVDCKIAPPHSKLVVFGDSYSDMGNIAIKGTLAMPKPFYERSRFSNGPVAVEWLAAARGLTDLSPSLHTIGCRVGYNFAVGGGNIRGAKPQDLERQVNAYLKMVENFGGADPDALFVVVMGGNDIRSLKGTPNADAAGGEIDQILAQLFTQLERLEAAGAKKFLVANSGNMSKLPGIINGPNPAVEMPRLQQYTDAYNTRFAPLFANFKSLHPTTIRQFDLLTTMSNIIGNAIFTHSTDACFDINQFPGPGQYHSGCAPGGANIDKFVFFDSVHASGKSHELLGIEMTNSAPP